MILNPHKPQKRLVQEKEVIDFNMSYIYHPILIIYYVVDITYI